MSIVNQRDGRLVAERVEVARTLAARLMGLIGRRRFPERSAFVIPGCRQVHTLLMSFPIDAVFLDAQNKVVHIAERVKPYRVTNYCRAGDCAIELPAGTISACGIKLDDVLLIEGIAK